MDDDKQPDPGTKVDIKQDAGSVSGRMIALEIDQVAGDVHVHLERQRAPEPPEPPRPPDQSDWCLVHPYGALPNFTGRLAERAMLTEWLEQDHDHPLLVIRALGGFGKSALAWHWLLNDVEPAHWPRVVWWCFYEPQSTFDSFLAESLAYLGVDVKGMPGPRQQADALLALLHQPGILLVLDGFERALRAYSSMRAAYQGDEADPGGDDLPGQNQRDCVSPVAEHFLRAVAARPGLAGKVLMTTRLTARVLEGHGGDRLVGCREVELTQLDPDDAVAFFRLQGIRGTGAEIEVACAAYGFHPLSLRLLAGLVAGDLQQPGDIAVAKRLDVTGDLRQRQHHVLEVAYDRLTPDRQKLLSRIACFRGSVGYDALVAVAEQAAGASGKAGASARVDADLRDLNERGLLHRGQVGNGGLVPHPTFDLHPIVRRYAYDRLAGADRQATHAALRDYFAAVPPLEAVHTLDDLVPVIELHHHLVAAGQIDEAWTLYHDRLHVATFYRFSAYQLCIDLLNHLLPDGQEADSVLEEFGRECWALNVVACCYRFTGQLHRAISLQEYVNEGLELLDDEANLAISSANLAIMQALAGELRAGEANVRDGIDLMRRTGDKPLEAEQHLQLASILVYLGNWAGADAEAGESQAVWQRWRDVDGQCAVAAWRARRMLMAARYPGLPSIRFAYEALAAAKLAVALSDESARDSYPSARQHVDVRARLGAAHRATGDLPAADRHLTEALTLCRAINLVDVEADILIDLARLRRDQAAGADGAAARAEALSLAQEALYITERCGYVLQGADAHLVLAQLALDAGDKATALQHAREARRLAYCDGGDYTYKVAYDEAGELLAALEAGDV